MSVNESDAVIREAHEMLVSGRKLVKEDNDSGISQLSDALALMVKNFGESDIKNSIYYIEYGKALLLQDDVLTNALKHLEHELCEDEQELEEKGALEESVKEVQNVSSSLVQAEIDADKVVELSNEQEQTDGKEGQSNEDTKTNGEVDRKAENLNLAWQLFDTARVIITNNKEMNAMEKSLQMGDVHHSLGEVALAEGNFDRGYEEFTKSVKLLGKSLKLSDPRIGRVQQLAGLCAVYEGYLEAAQFHYTAAAENYNIRLEELLVEAGVLKPKNPSDPESEDIEFIDRKYLDILKARVGEQSDVFKKCLNNFDIVNDLVGRVEEIVEEEEQNKSEIIKLMKLLELKMKNGEIPGVKSLNAKGDDVVECKNSGQVVTEQFRFDSSPKPVTGEVKNLGTFGGKVRRLASLGKMQEVVGSPSKKVRTM